MLRMDCGRCGGCCWCFVAATAAAGAAAIAATAAGAAAAARGALHWGCPGLGGPWVGVCPEVSSSHGLLWAKQGAVCVTTASLHRLLGASNMAERQRPSPSVISDLTLAFGSSLLPALSSLRATEARSALQSQELLWSVLSTSDNAVHPRSCRF